jgi:hypothetical protein
MIITHFFWGCSTGFDISKYLFPDFDRIQDWRFRNLKKPPVLRPTVNLTYRGVKYNKPGTVTTKTVEPKKITTVSIE